MPTRALRRWMGAAEAGRGIDRCGERVVERVGAEGGVRWEVAPWIREDGEKREGARREGSGAESEMGRHRVWDGNLGMDGIGGECFSNLDFGIEP